MRKAYASMSLALGAGVRIDCNTYPEDPQAGPILAITAHHIHLALSPAARGAVTAADVDMAHRLAEAVAVYVADIERLHAHNSHSSGESAAA